MARYERFDDDTPAPKFTITTSSNNENSDLLVLGNTTLSKEDERTVRHALITLNIISIFVSTVCSLITFFLAIEERSVSALGFALDTILDVLAFSTIIWRFMSSEDQAKREVYVLRILSLLFFVSGLAIFIDSISDLYHRTHPIPNQYLAIAVGIQTFIFLCLAVGKYTVAKKLNVISAYSDAFNTTISALMAFSVTISTIIYNSTAKFWYLDSLVGMFISITIMVYGIWLMLKSFSNII
ncbi:hypothetical protein I4U23_014356 [Adineta vaga]|nr:hypothetical protein I4U23_014356 [Adineta vaga]